MTEQKKICGIIMPISQIDNCTESHWSDVLAILNEAIELSGYEPNLVSNADDVGIIHKRIVQNLYENPIVICDVSGRNPNVMFELGMRLAFDKPTIIIKDDKTSYSFDTSAIEHIEYPRDLRFSRIIDFKQKLIEKIKATIERSKNDPEHTTFLKHFGQFKVAKLDKKEVTGQEFIIDELKALRASISRLDRNNISDSNERIGRKYNWRTNEFNICLKKISPEEKVKLIEDIMMRFPVTKAEFVERGDEHHHLIGSALDADCSREVERFIMRRHRTAEKL